MIGYHGSNNKFEKFSEKHIGTSESNDQYGSGYYFFVPEKSCYCSNYGKYLYECELDTKKTIIWEDRDDIIIPYDVIRQLILNSPYLEERLRNFGDYEYYGFQKVLHDTIEIFIVNDVINCLNCLGNDFYCVETTSLLLNKFVELTGYDSVFIEEDGIIVALTKDIISIKRRYVNG